MAIERHSDPSNIEGAITWGDEGKVNGTPVDTVVDRPTFRVRGTVNFKGESARAAARGKNVVMHAIAKSSVDALHRAKQGQGPRQSGR